MKLLLVTLLSALALAGCTTTQTERQEQREIKAQAPADTPEEIAGRASKAFSDAPGLTEEQKAKLNTIYTQVYTESMQIRREMGQAKSLLFMTLAKPDYRASQITSLKNKIVKLDKQRLQIMFDALDDVQAVVGNGAEKENIYRHFEDHEYPRGMRLEQ